MISNTDFGRKSRHFYDEDSLMCVPCEKNDLHSSLRAVHTIIEAVLSSLPWVFLIIYGACCLIISIMYGY